MKTSLTLLAVAATAALAGPVKFGADALAGYNILAIGDHLDNAGTESKASFGFAIGPTVAYAINDQFSLGGKLSVLYDINRMSNPGVSGKSSDAIQPLGLGLQFAPSFQINKQVEVKLGYEWDIPLAGSADLGSTSPDIVWAPDKGSDLGSNEAGLVSTQNVVLGGSYAVIPNLAVTLQGKIALTGIYPKYKTNGDLDGAASSKDNIDVHQIAVGVHYSFN